MAFTTRTFAYNISREAFWEKERFRMLEGYQIDCLNERGDGVC
ncbi:MAG: hypothetical protein AAF850_03890 [Pseudomonadota bacterium]